MGHFFSSPRHPNKSGEKACTAGRVISAGRTSRCSGRPVHVRLYDPDLQEEHLSAMTIQHTDSAVPSGSLPTNQTTTHTCHHAATHAQHTHKTHTRHHHQNPTQPQTKHQTTQQNPTPPQNQPPQKPKISAHGFGSAEKREGKRGKGKKKKGGKEKEEKRREKEKYQHTGSNRGLQSLPNQV